MDHHSRRSLMSFIGFSRATGSSTDQDEAALLEEQLLEMTKLNRFFYRVKSKVTSIVPSSIDPNSRRKLI